MKELDPAKAGSDFVLQLDYAADGVPEDFSVTQLSSQVRDDRGERITTLAVTAVNGVPGRFLAKATAAQTTTWPVGKTLFCDVKRNDGSTIDHTETVYFSVIRAQTA